MFFSRMVARLVVPVVAVGSFVGLAAPSAHAADGAGPAIVSVRVQPGSVDITHAEKQIAVTVHATDATGVAAFAATLTGPSGSTPITQTASTGVGFDQAVVHAGTETDGWWTFKMTVPQTTEPGTW